MARELVPKRVSAGDKKLISTNAYFTNVHLQVSACIFDGTRNAAAFSFIQTLALLHYTPSSNHGREPSLDKPLVMPKQPQHGSFRKYLIGKVFLCVILTA